MTNPPQVPDGLVHVRTTEVFDRETVPAGLLKAHKVADGVWGRLVVHTGTVRFVFEDGQDEPAMVSGGDAVIIPPRRLHHVELDGPATFAIEFHRESNGITSGTESTGLDSK